MANTKNDTIHQALVAGGFGVGSSETIARMERKRLLGVVGKTESASLSLNDLYALAGERPRLY